MSESRPLPRLVTFDGEARSGKGTIVQFTKDYLRDEHDYKVMLIDAGQVFRVLVVAATQAAVDMEDPDAIDAFLDDEEQASRCVALVKDVYHMQKDERDALLYTNEVGANSAKIGARPGSQDFKDELLRKWLHDAGSEGYEVVLLDGRALEETGIMLQQEKLCDFVLGLYFTCDPIVGARRTLGLAAVEYEAMTSEQRKQTDELVEQINARNKADRERAVQPIKPPKNAQRYSLPDAPSEVVSGPERIMAIFDTSANIDKPTMARPVAEFASTLLNS